MLQGLGNIMQAEQLMVAQNAIKQIHCSPSLLDYLQRLLHASRTNGDFSEGLSPRAGLALLQAARAWAALEGRDHIIPEDVQAVFIPVAAHRLHVLQNSPGSSFSSHDLLVKLIRNVAI